MKYAQWVVAGSVISLAAAVIRPDVAHLALRAVLAIAITFVTVHLLIAAFHRVPPSPFEAVAHTHDLSSPQLPRDLAGLADELRARGQFVSDAVAVRLAREFAVTLATRRGLTADDLVDPPTLQRHLSPTAAALVASSGALSMTRRQLDPLLHELEHL